MELLINGERLDLSGDKLALKFTSKVMGIDKMEASRSQAFVLPMTPRNMRIFGFPHRVDMLATPVRDTFSAQLIYDGGVIYGTFKVTGVTDERVSGTLIYGELSQLITEWYKKKLNEIFISPEHIMLREGEWYYENSRNLNNALYYNGVGHDKSFRLPSVSVPYLLTQCLTVLGTSAPAVVTAAADMRIILNTLNGYGGNIDAGSIGCIYGGGVNGYFDTSALTYFGSYFVPDIMVITNEDGSGAHVLTVLRCTQSCKVSITGTNPQFVASVTSYAGQLEARKKNNGWRRLGAGWAGQPHTGSWVIANILSEDYRTTVEYSDTFEIGDALVYAQRVSSAWAWISTNASFTIRLQGLGEKLQLFNDGTSWTMGDYYLQPNMPDLTLAGLLKLVARVTGNVLTYDETTNTFGLFDYDFDGAGGAVVAIEPRLKRQGDVKRQTFDYGQTHAVRFEFAGDEIPAYTRDYGRRMVEYTTPNKTLDVRTEEVLPIATYNSKKKNPAYPQFFDISVNCVEYDEATNKWPCKEIDKPVLARAYTYNPEGYTSRNLDTYALAMNPHLQEICRLSTAVEVEVAMRMFEFVAIESSTRFTYRGAWWFCSGGTWADGVAKLALQRYK